MSEKLTQEQLEECARTFFTNKKVLIVDRSPACREGAKGVVLDFGAKDGQIRTCSRFDEALKYIEEEQPHVVMTDFAFGEHSAMEFLPVVSSYMSSHLEKLFVIITNNASETAVAEAAEGDVDAFVLKPFSRLFFREYLLKVIYPKLHPSDYLTHLEKGKVYLKQGMLDDAERSFEEARKIADEPALAFFFLGQVQEARENWDKAADLYGQGLNANSVHYRCLLARFQLLEKQKKLDEAYGAAQKLITHFPMNAERLGKIMQLAVFTHNFADVQRYFDQFKKLEHRPEDLVKTVQAALYVCGKFLVQKGMEESALKAFRDAIVTSGHDLDLIEKSVTFLLDHKMAGGAANTLRLYPMEKRDSNDYQILDLFVLSQTEPLEIFVRKAREKIKTGDSSPELYFCVADGQKESGDLRGFEITLFEGMEKFPERAEEFKKRLKEGTA